MSGQHLRQVVAEYDYIGCRTARLSIRSIVTSRRTSASGRSDGKGGWNWKGPERPVPYKLPELIAAAAPVLIAAGEKDVDNLRES